MKHLSGPKGLVELHEVAGNPKPTGSVKQVLSVETQPTFTLTFTLGTQMREIQDAVIRTVLQYGRGNRLRAAQLLDINPRTIRRRLGKKDTPGAFGKEHRSAATIYPPGGIYLALAGAAGLSRFVLFLPIGQHFELELELEWGKSSGFLLGRHHDRAARLDNASLLERDFRQGIPQHGHMVQG